MTMPETIPLAFQRYGGRLDLPALLAFASEAIGLRAPGRATWHPGDIVWGLKPNFDDAAPLYAVKAGEAVIAAFWLQGPGALLLEVLPEHEQRAGEIIGHIEGLTSAERLDITAFDSDLRRQQALAALGFQRRGPAGVQFALPLAAIPQAPPPPGFRLHDCVSVDPDARATAHRDAWSALGHIGLPDARSGFTTETYLSLLDAPGYDPALDIVLAAPDGRLVGNCIAWADTASGVGIFEPVGVHPEFRGRGLAGAVLAEGLRRMRARGLTTAWIGTAHFNAAAIAAYSALGFAQVDSSSVWSKTS
jgi:GNAT superfamily N-acetyltransferase